MSLRTWNIFIRSALLATVVFGSSLLATRNIALADAAADLKSGQTALDTGEFDKALPLLKSAAQDLPQSVEAQLALAECYLKLGQADRALEKYQAVLKLSPDHAAAKRIVEGLTGQAKSYAQSLELARTFISIAAYGQAEAVLQRALADPTADADREEARLLLAQARLWSLKLGVALDDSVRLIQGPATGNAAYQHQGRVLAALVLLNDQPEPNVERAAALLQQIPAEAFKPRGDDAAVKPADGKQTDWRALHDTALLLVELADRSGTPETAAQRSAKLSAQLGKRLQVLPIGPYRTNLVERVFARLIAQARELIGRGQPAAAADIVWPMVSAGDRPTVIAKSIELTGGWLDRRPTAMPHWFHVSQIFMQVGKADFDARGPEAKLVGYWLAAEVLRQSPESPAHPNNLQHPVTAQQVDHLLQIPRELAALSRPAADRKSGTPLSTADTLQLSILQQIVPLVVNEAQRTALVDLLIEHVARYQRASDIEWGLAQITSIGAIAELKPSDRVKLIGALDTLPIGAAQQKLLTFLADRFAELGAREFQESAATLDVAANQQVNRFDIAALSLYGQLAAQYPQTANSVAAVEAIVARYSSIEAWAAASDAANRFYALLSGDAGGWAAIRLKLSQSQRVEDRSIAAQRQLGKELSPSIKAALAETLKIVAANPSKTNRRAAIQIFEPLVTRYISLERLDLAEAVIAIVAPSAAIAPQPGIAPQPANADPKAADDKQPLPAVAEPKALAELNGLADWAAWMRITILELQAARALAVTTSKLDPATKPTLNTFHQREIEQLAAFIAKYPKSEYLAQAVERLVNIATTYQNYRAFDVATSVLNDFLKAHPKLAFAERLEYQLTQVAVVRAQMAFGERKDKTKPPEKLSEEYSAAIDVLTKFLKARPTGTYASAAENELLGIARVYGQAGAWPVALAVIEKFAAAVPDYRSPAHLQLLRAATYLGQLDTNYGLSLLTPVAPLQPRAGMMDSQYLSMHYKDAPDANGPMDKAREKMSLADVAKSGDSTPRSSGGAGGMLAGGGTMSGPVGQTATALPTMPPGSGFGNGIGGGPKDALEGQLFDGAGLDPASRMPSSDVNLAAIRNADRQRVMQIAMLETKELPIQARGKRDAGDDIALPSGPVLSTAAMKQQDEASDKAYEILIALVKSNQLADASTAEQARAHLQWMFGFFEGQLRADRTVALIARYLKDQPADPARVSLAFRALGDQLAWAAQKQATDRINKQWIDARHELFEAARADIDKFIKEYADRKDWVEQAQILRIDSFDRESQLAAVISPVRAGGLLLQAADEITDLLQKNPEHPAISNFPERLWNIAERLVRFGQQDQAINVLGQIPMYFPTHARAVQAVLREAELYATNLANPLRAIETYQEYLGLVGDNEQIRAQIFSIAQQLALKQRYLEALHVFAAFVDSFPTDARAPEALRQIGQTHQSNEAWDEALKAYQRLLTEYPGVPITPQVKLAVAECYINISNWRAARKLYEEYLQQYPGDGQIELAKSRIEILKNLDRYQTLLADDQVQRNKDDAQFQIGVIVLEKLNMPLKAVAEFRKVVAEYPKSPQADDAQLELGKALLTLNRLDEARAELLKVSQNFQGSPLADDALFLVGQSYERAAQKLAVVTGQSARAEAFEKNQRGAYMQFNESLQKQEAEFQGRRSSLKKAGKSAELDLDEAAQAFRIGSANLDTLGATARLADMKAETESALQVVNRQDRINEAYRQAVTSYAKAANDYPLGDMTDDALLRMAQIFETELKDRPAAMETYQKVVKFFPGTPVAEDAAWKVAKFYEQEGKYKEAVDAYREFIRNYPASGRVADAQYAMAETLEQLGRWVEAMDAYETFRQKFTSHPKAQTAQEQIIWIKAYRK